MTTITDIRGKVYIVRESYEEVVHSLNIKGLSEFTNVSMPNLALEVIYIFSINPAHVILVKRY